MTTLMLESLGALTSDFRESAGNFRHIADKISSLMENIAEQISGTNSEEGNRVVLGLVRAAQCCGTSARILDAAHDQILEYVGLVGYSGEFFGNNHPLFSVSANHEQHRIPLNFQEIQDAVTHGSMNTGYAGVEGDPRAVNCGECALMGDFYLAGRPFRPAHLWTYSDDQMASATGRKRVETSAKFIAEKLKEAGPGSHDVIGVMWRGRDSKNFYGGHWLNAYCDEDLNIWAIDFQAGTIVPWPPYSAEEVLSWDSSQ